MDILIKNQALTESNPLNKALIIVNCLFKNKCDKIGAPYVEHLYYVSNNVDTVDEKTVGLLHDVIEDTDITACDLRELGFKENVINSVKLLTRDKQIPYQTYIDNIINSNDKIALNVKIEDMKHNMKKDRMEKLSKETCEKLNKKYSEAYIKLIRKKEENDRY